MPNRKPFKNQTVSEGTLRDSDLLSAMLGVLIDYRPKKFAELIREAQEIEKKYPDFGYLSYLHDVAPLEEIDEIEFLIMEKLPNAMDTLAPEKCYYGAHPGDGSLFGFWEEKYATP